MASFDDDVDPNAGSGDEDENEDEEMEDVNDGDQDGDQDMDQGGDDEEEDDDNEDNDNDDDDDEDQNEQDSPSRRESQANARRRSTSRNRAANTSGLPTSPSHRTTDVRSPGRSGILSFTPPTREIALTAQAYDIVPTMAAPQGTSINAITATPDMRWVFSGGTDGYVRMYNWVETANGKVPLTVAQKHPFVDSVMKAGSLLTYWENEETMLRTPPTRSEEGKWTSPVYSLAVQHQALWLLSGLESGGINLQTCRHQAGTVITTLKEHTSAVSVLNLSSDENSLLSGSWDKNVYDWDLSTGKTKRSFAASGSQIAAIETRPLSDMSVPEVSQTQSESLNGTFSSNNADRPLANGMFTNGIGRRESRVGAGEEDALGSPEGSLFGEGDHGSLFGEDMGGGGGGNAFGDDDDDLTRALESEMQDIEPEAEPLPEPDAEKDATADTDVDMAAVLSSSPVASPKPATPKETAEAPDPPLNGDFDATADSNAVNIESNQDAPPEPSEPITNGLPHADEPLTAPPTHEEDQKSSSNDLPPQSESTFLDAAIDGILRIWDRRMASPIATIVPYGGTPPWCTGACWSPDGNFFYAGRRTNSVDEYSIHHLGSKRSEPSRVFKFQQGSGFVYAVRAMPNKKHLVWYVGFRSSFDPVHPFSHIFIHTKHLIIYLKLYISAHPPLAFGACIITRSDNLALQTISSVFTTSLRPRPAIDRSLSP